MTLNDARQMLHAIAEKAASGDHEAAHALEDQLHLETLLALANDDEMPDMHRRHLAWLATTSQDIKFQRACA